MALYQKLYRLETTQVLPVTMDEAWDFFSSPENLKEITPDHMGFDITSPTHEKMYPGMLITYRVSPLLGIKMRWCTEITQVKENQYFIDEQRFGPYNLWHHQHHFKSVDGGVEMKDIVHYGIPLGILGRIANKLFVKGQLRKIFEYRTVAIEKKWPDKSAEIAKVEVAFFSN